MTTYDRPDERLIVEHMLPGLLGISRAAASEGTERNLFLVEVAEALKRMRGRFYIVSSATAITDEGARPYPWIWQSIRHASAGARQQCAQHSKLWMLHWKGDNHEEYLQTVVSSANLTLSSFRDQIQAGWHCMQRLNTRSDESSLRSWGVLPRFLAELDDHCGAASFSKAAARLLGRTRCPSGAEFVASVPGVHGNQTPWGTRGLTRSRAKRSLPCRLRILVPFVGAWSASELERFARQVAAEPDSIELCWIPKHHTWEPNWVLPAKTRDVFSQLGGHFLVLPTDADGLSSLFHRDYRGADPRWPHLKLYHFSVGRTNRLLVTSANFSPSAWGCEDGRGRVRISNFECGVLADSTQWPLAELSRCERPKNLAVRTTQDEVRLECGVWADASWNGKTIDLAWRVSEGAPSRISVEAHRKRRKVSIPTRGMTATGKRRIPWRSQSDVPAWLHLSAGGQSIQVPVYDARVSRENASLVPDLDDESYRNLRDQLLMEKYDGPVAGNGGEHVEHKPGSPTSKDDYGVDALVFAREQFRIVDTWADKLEKSQDSAVWDAVRRDGENLRDAFARRAEALARRPESHVRAIGARAATEEFKVRLRTLKAR